MHVSGLRCLCSLACCLIAAPAVAEDVAVETVLTGLKRPCGVAVQPGGLPTRFQLFVSDTAAGRVVRMASDAPGRVAEAIAGFHAASGGNGPFNQVGPRGLLFLDDLQLVVASRDESVAAIRLYGLPADEHAIQADQPRQQLELPTGSGYGGYALARTRANEVVPGLLIATVVGAGNHGRLLQCRVQADFLGELQPFGGEQATGELRAPVAVTVSGSGYVVVGQTGALDASQDGKISIHNPADGATLLSLDTKLHDVVGLAYSPTTGNLYAADFSAAAPDDGGVHRIDDASRPGRPACRSVKIADIRRPTALAFGPDGALYVTAFGDTDDDGALVKITGGL